MRNGLWLIFSAILFGIACWFSFKAGRQVWSYWRHSEPVAAQLSDWKIHRESGSKFFLVPRYTYRVGSVEYQGKGVLCDRPYRNPWAAEMAIPHLEERGWKVWVDPQRPGDSLLLRSFPIKPLFYAAILIGLFFYFTWIGLLVNVRQGQAATQVDCNSK